MLKIVLSTFFVGMSLVACKKDGELTEIENEDPEGVVEYDGTWYQTGDTVFGYNDYVYLVVGNEDSPLLLGVPHDGTGTGTPQIPKTGTTGRDLYTGHLANHTAEHFESDTEKKPWMIVNTIHRSRVDPNTYPSDAPGRYTDPDALATYQSYHELLLLARSTIANAQAGGKGALFLDLHGHAHKYANDHEEPYVSITSGNTVHSKFIHQSEVGYGLSNFSLEQADSYLDGLADSASIYYLSTTHPNVPFSELIRGADSFGGLLEAENFSAVPSDEKPILDRNHLLFGGTVTKPNRRPYFNGGFVTRKYGTIQTGSTTGFNDNVVSIQLETPGINVRNNPRIRERSSHQLKRAIINYLNIWFGYNYTNSPYPF